ncbi:MAG: hypothetical protein RJQ10_16345 [Haliea sp.]|uniref:hypothetical protein n=1 Tax=Haliea sp. TaxID=1932666 RepID=UPI0032EE2635
MDRDLSASIELPAGPHRTAGLAKRLLAADPDSVPIAADLKARALRMLASKTHGPKVFRQDQ